MKGDDTPITPTGDYTGSAFDNYRYGFDSAKDFIYEKIRILESVVALLKGEVERFNVPSLTTVQSPVAFEFVEFLKTDEGVRVASRWLEGFEIPFLGTQILAMRLLLQEASLSCSDQLMLCQSIDTALDSLTKDLVLYERAYRTRP